MREREGWMAEGEREREKENKDRRTVAGCL